MAIDTDTPPIDLLPLIFCPNCDYSLQGLAASGVCPECGRSYDQSFIVLRGKPVRDSTNDALIRDSSVTPRRFFGALVMPAILLFGIGIAISHPVYFVYVCFLLADACLGLLAWHTSTRRGDVLVWLSSQGIGQEPTEDRRLLATRFRGWMRLAYFPIFFFWVIWSGGQPDVFTMILIGIFTFVFAASVVSKRRLMRESIRVVDPDVSIYPWSLFNYVVLENSKNDRWRLRAHVDSRVRSSNLVNIEFPASDAIAFKLRKLITEWHSAGRQSIAGPPAGESRGRKIGRVIREIFVTPARKSQPA